jgi:intracellular sulfur oxidation DsrE/DsrF family protein
MDNQKQKSHRRSFLGKLAAVAAATGLLSVPSSIIAAPSLLQQPTNDADEWFNKVKGKHRIVFDATRPNGLFPFVWPRVFLVTNGVTGTPEKDNGVVVILRHEAICYAFEDRIWTKYKFGEMFKADDPLTKTTSLRNPFWNTKPGDYQVPGFGNVAIGISDLQDSGVMFAVCNAAMTVFSTVVAQKTNTNAADVMKDWTAGLLPGVQIVPSGVWAVGRAQEHGCAYCFAG